MPPYFAFSEIVIENNYLLRNLLSDLFSTVENVNLMRISMNNKLHTLLSNNIGNAYHIKKKKPI